MTLKSFIFDFETLGNAPSGKVVDLSCLVVDLNQIENPPKFKDLVSSAKKWKIDLKSQLDRTASSAVISWWQKQPESVKVALKENGSEISLNSAINQFNEYLLQNGFDSKNGFGYCRGQSFDFPILIDIIRKKVGMDDTFDFEPCRFWNQRDIRSVISGIMLNDAQTTVPLRKGILDGFVKHNSIHDIAKDALMIIYAKRYALGIDTLPSIDDADSNTI